MGHSPGWTVDVVQVGLWDVVLVGLWDVVQIGLWDVVQVGLWEASGFSWVPFADVGD